MTLQFLIVISLLTNDTHIKSINDILVVLFLLQYIIEQQIYETFTCVE